MAAPVVHGAVDYTRRQWLSVELDGRFAGMLAPGRYQFVTPGAAALTATSVDVPSGGLERFVLPGSGGREVELDVAGPAGRLQHAWLGLSGGERCPLCLATSVASGVAQRLRLPPGSAALELVIEGEVRARAPFAVQAGEGLQVLALTLGE